MVELVWTRIETESPGPIARSSHGASLIDKGNRLVVYGGENVARTPIEYEEALWILHLSNNTWQNLQPENPPPVRVAHAQAVYQDHCLYVFGGRAGITMQEQAMDDMWMLDLSNPKSWIKVEYKGGRPPEARSFHRMICIENLLYVFGGCGVSGRLADLHCFDISTGVWTSLGNANLRGRGGPNMIPLSKGDKIGVLAGFAGEETNDGQCFDRSISAWQETLLNDSLDGLRPRSVCISVAVPSTELAIIFGGEVDPSDRGHEGAGGFSNDIVLLDERTGALSKVISPDSESPPPRGWSSGDAVDNGDGSGILLLFGGLSGDDKNPKRLDDTWKLTIRK